MAGTTSRALRVLQAQQDLIEAVRKRRPLWDNTMHLHKNGRVLAYCWQQVAAELRMNVCNIKKKWKGIREYFFKQTKKLEKHGKFTGNSSKQYLWPLYDKLKFLLDVQKNKIDYSTYSMNHEELMLLREVTEHDKKHRKLEKIIFHVPSSPPNVTMRENTSVPTPIVLSDNETEQVGAPASQSRNTPPPPPLRVNKSTPITNQEKVLELVNKVTLCEPPPLRILNVPKADSSNPRPALTPDLSQPPSKKLKPSEVKLNEPEIAIDPDDADLHFFKSLLPFMKALPLKRRLRVRTEIQELIYGELDAIQNDLQCTTCQTKSVNKDRQVTQDKDAKFSEELNPYPRVIVKEEIVDGQTLAFEVNSNNITFECDGDH